MTECERVLHNLLETSGYRGSWEIETAWGKIKIQLLPERIGFGSQKGRPDELLTIKVAFNLLGKNLEVQAPVIIECEERSGISGALKDLYEGKHRDGYLKIPMLVLGRNFGKDEARIDIKADVKIWEIPSSKINTSSRSLSNTE